jgi:hypothetical protein
MLGRGVDEGVVGRKISRRVFVSIAVIIAGASSSTNVSTEGYRSSAKMSLQ